MTYYSTPVSVESTSSLRITVDNLLPSSSGIITPLWFAFHDGSFDSFNVGEAASSGIELIAEEGISGAAGDEIVAIAIERGLDVTSLPNLQPIAATFAESEAAQNGGSQGAVTLAPTFLNRRAVGQFSGERASTTIAFDGNASGQRFFNYAAMFFPSNDAFIGNDDQTSIEIFDESGNFVGADFIVSGAEVYDAGTEVNDEDPNTIPLTLANVGEGVDENGTVQLHPGFLPAGSGGILDQQSNPLPFGGDTAPSSYENADFTVPGTNVARIQVELVTVTTITGTNRRDYLRGSNDSDDIIFGGNRRDFLIGKAGNDTLNGENGRDFLLGGKGEDVLIGGQGRDYLIGGKDNDILEGGLGRDYLIGGDGEDWFVFGEDSGSDTIADFEVGVDTIIFGFELASNFSDLDLIQRGHSTRIRFDGGALTLRNVDVADLSESDFIFA